MPHALQHLTRDAWLLLATRFIRLFAYGALSVVLVFYLVDLGSSESQTGLLLTSTLIGDTVVSLYLTTRAARIGRRRILIVGATLMAAAGLVFASTRNLWLLILIATGRTCLPGTRWRDRQPLPSARWPAVRSRAPCSRRRCRR